MLVDKYMSRRQRNDYFLKFLIIEKNSINGYEIETYYYFGP